MVHEMSGISVVISYYNREQYIDEAIQSVLAQTLQPLEIIIVNDGSRESSRRYLDRYAAVCTIVDLPVNLGLAAARNEGVRRSRGRWIAFLDDDDIWLPEKLAIQMRYLEKNPTCDAVQSAAWAFFTHKSDELWGFDRPSPLTLAQALTRAYSMLQPTMLIRADVLRALEGFDPRFRRAQDYEFMIRFAAAGYRMESIPEPLARIRRQGHECVTKNNCLMFLAHVGLCWKHKALYYRVYGLRGIVKYVLVSQEIHSRKVRYVGGAARLLLRFIPIKWKVRPDYEESIQRKFSSEASPAGFPHDG
jgi:glycosyltransferase involved in cell wall biosynthesis